jgi:probable phosphoglycerate mutase
MTADATEKPTRRRLYLLRHGEVRYFDEQGQPFRPDTVPLTAEGQRQAEAVRAELAGVTFERVLTSDLLRCVETAEIVAAGRGVPVESCADLREVRPGRLADLPANGIEQAFLGAFTAGLTREARFLGGETFGSLVDRVTGCVARLLAEPGWRRALVVAHGGVNRAILAAALGGELTGFAALEQDPCCVNVLDVDGEGRWIVRLVNHTPYNAAKAGMELTTMERLLREYRRR